MFGLGQSRDAGLILWGRAWRPRRAVLFWETEARRIQCDFLSAPTHYPPADDEQSFCCPSFCCSPRPPIRNHPSLHLAVGMDLPLWIGGLHGLSLGRLAPQDLLPTNTLTAINHETTIMP